MNSFEQKQGVMRALLERHGLDALILQRTSSFAWATDGKASYINTASSTGEATLIITRDSRYLLTSNIEAPRLEQEEKLKEQGWEFKVAPWYEPNPALSELTARMKLGSDVAMDGVKDLSGDITRLRLDLKAEEGERFRQLGKMCAAAMESACHSIKPGMSEYELAAILGAASQERGAQPIVNLIATDERILNYRHPLPTAKKLEKYAMLILCGRWMGLVCSVTRLVHFGPLPEEIKHKIEACARVDAALIAGTRPGRTVGEIFSDLQKAYAAEGYDGEWKLHHQGGPAGYEAREYIATPGSEERVRVGQVYAWNPSITGTKMEDTILVGEDRNEVLTEMSTWPMIEVPVPGGSIKRPVILEILN